MQSNCPSARILRPTRRKLIGVLCAVVGLLGLGTPNGEAVAAMLLLSWEVTVSGLDTDRMRSKDHGALSDDQAEAAGSERQWPLASILSQESARFTLNLIEGFSREIADGFRDGAVPREGHGPVRPVAPSPSAVFLFGPGVIGILGILLRQGSHLKPTTVTGESWRETVTSARSNLIFLSSPDPLFAGEVEERLRGAGYTVRVVPTADDIVILAQQTAPSLILVDQRMTDWDILRTDSRLKHVPMMLLVPAGAKYTDADTLVDLERGADGVHLCRDSWRLFLAKVGAYLRRAGYDVSRRGVYRVGAVELDADLREVKVGGQRVSLSAKPFAILEAFMRAPSKVFSRNELVDLVWGPQFAIGEHTLDVHVHALRQQLDRDPHRRCRLVTIKGVGFKLRSASPAIPVSSIPDVLPMAADSLPILQSGATRRSKSQRSISSSPSGNRRTWLRPVPRQRRARPLSSPTAIRHPAGVASVG